jgi:hypothetical protein
MRKSEYRSNGSWDETEGQPRKNKSLKKGFDKKPKNKKEWENRYYNGE